ncbi:MAG: DUF6691 family protein [Pseudomonadota bacterium]
MKNQTIFSFIIALIFGLGLALSGMTSRENVIGFLDFFGNWKPALALVMGFGILAAAGFFHFSKQFTKPINGSAFPILPTKIDAKLIIGAAIFGIGWGIGGICPGPAIVLLAIAPSKIVLFIVAMAIGGLLTDFVTKLNLTRAKPINALNNI